MKPIIQKISLIFSFLFSTANTFAQNPTKTQPIDPVVDRQFRTITEVTAKPVGTTGSIYLAPSWLPGVVHTKAGNALKDIPMNYDLKNNVMEFYTKEGVKILNSEQITKFEWQAPNTLERSVYLNCNQFTFEDTKHVGFYKVLISGNKMQLLSRTELIVRKANYVPIMDVGNKGDNILKEEKLYIATGNKVTALKDKDSFSVFYDKEALLKAYAKTNKLKLTRKEDAIKLVEYYNSI